MGFQLSGVVREVRLAVGDMVTAGDTIAVLNNTISTPLFAGQGVADAQNAKLTDLKTGAKPQDVDTYAAQAGSAQVATTTRWAVLTLRLPTLIPKCKTRCSIILISY